MSILDSFVAYGFLRCCWLSFYFMWGNDNQRHCKTHKPGNRLKWKLHKRHSKNPNVEVSEVYFYINSFILAYIRLK